MVWATLGRQRYQQLKNMPQTTAARAVSCSPTAQHPLQTAQEQAAHTAHTGAPCFQLQGALQSCCFLTTHTGTSKAYCQERCFSGISLFAYIVMDYTQHREASYTWELISTHIIFNNQNQTSSNLIYENHRAYLVRNTQEPKVLCSSSLLSGWGKRLHLQS